ncbi:MAG: phage tail tape measure protein [Tidjanibacter sp.]|nr:phage tail tape measure protein [Tidjanibacter sp.]
MSTQTFNYSFNILGNSGAVLPQITTTVTELNAKLNSSVSIFTRVGSAFIQFNQATQALQGAAYGVADLNKSGADLQSSLADLSAISGETGSGLRTIEKYARDAAKTFGGSAAQSVESYKLLLSQLSPELAKTPAALKAMGDNISILSKTMGGDTTAAAEVLTTAMNQYGVSLQDPIKASQRMAEMMNVMAAAGKEGSAELPQIKQALEQCGMAAKGAGVTFEETNAAIQVLDKAGKKGAEGGVALRNVMTTLARGRFLPKDVQKELQAAGVNINALTDKSKSLSERLTLLQPVMNDSALFSKLFGRENVNAAMALVQGISEVERYTTAITGTNIAVEQAGIIMDTYNERLSRVQAQFDNIKISIFNATGDLGIWTQVITTALVPISQLVPLLSVLTTGIKRIIALNWAGMWAGITHACRAARISLVFMNADLKTGQMASLGFMRNIVRATLAIGRFATVGLLSGIKALGAWVLSLVTGGAASVTFAGIASASFTTFKTAAVSACRAVGIAIMNIPIIGWIAAAVAALVAIGVHFWNTSAKFRAVLKGLGAAFVQVFRGIWDMAKNVFGGIGDLFVACFKFDGQGIKNALKRMGGGFKEYGANIGKAFSEGYNGELARAKAERPKDGGDTATGTPEVEPTEGDPIATGLSGVGGVATSTDKVKNIIVTIDKLVDKFEVNTTNLHDDVSRVKDMVAEALVGAVNDLNYSM